MTPQSNVCVCETCVGYGGAAWYVAHAIIHTAS